jgi:glycosyltransferase involved in cell wall biosynthesis
VIRPRGLVLLPAFNESESLGGVLRGLEYLLDRCEIVVVDDGSRDGTGDLARRLGTTVLTHPFNLGYGAALQTGYKYGLTRGVEFVVQMDADGQHEPADVGSLLEELLQGESDIVIGSRFLEPTAYRMGTVRSLGRKLFSFVGSLAGLRVSDPTSGFQALGRRAIELYAEEFFPSDYPDIDVLLVAHRCGLNVREVPVAMKQAERASRLHGGLKSWYYVYRLALSLWAGSAGRRAVTEPPAGERPARR